MKDSNILKFLILCWRICAGVNRALIIVQLKFRNHSYYYFIPLLPLLILFGVFSVTLHVAHAQAETPSEPYTVRTGDFISVVVDGYPAYSKQLVVRLDGFISYPLIDYEIRAEGLTISQIADEISKGLLAHIEQPRVFVTLVRSKERYVYVWGAVQLPNRYAFESEQLYLSHALAFAGGYDYNKAKLTAVQVWRDGKIHRTVDLVQLMAGENQEDIPIQADDVIFVPNLLQQRPIMVTGAILETGPYPIESPKIHPLQALMLAGGPKPDVADLARAIIIKTTGERIAIDLETAFEGGANTDIPMLSRGDTLYIPDAYQEEKISVLGAVARPGQHRVKAPVDVMEALSLAGGWLENRANLKKVLIIRSDGRTERVNLDELLETENLQGTPLLAPGDRVHVPDRFRINWSVVLASVSTVGIIYNILRR